jgi:hypothetical protein
MERAEAFAGGDRGVGGFRFLECAGEACLDDGVDLRIHLLDPCDVGLHRFDGGNFFGADQRGELRRRHPDEIIRRIG